MAKCIAESILTNPKDAENLNGLDCRIRYNLWINYGYCNGLNGKCSFGLGGNICQSLHAFTKSKEPLPFEDTSNSDRQINGCGVVMRLAPCGLFSLDNLDKTLRFCS